ncbi:alpha/beta fold hydrolase [Lentzea nigeriaca]|uniref:alpha/beta fold hydrolase n=1 Tax=Lentzea nigeriaca TaxID=1128665 RepID=UPI001958D0C9|nr:alpha/beta hydrolase [Lentzea nigeriaca]MBM7860789.1 pimeloyl-ACP methyl ester carboxylesterase [Lentzea nigeriaca]
MDLAHDELGSGAPLLVVPGGPLLAPSYLGDLGGIPARLHLLHLRGTGRSGPADPADLRFDLHVDDVEAYRAHAGLDPVDVLAHSAGAAIAIRYALRYPSHVRRLVLVTPSLRSLGTGPDLAQLRAVAESRSDEPWYPAIKESLEAVLAGSVAGTDWAAMTPFFYARWDDAAQEHARTAEATRLPNAASAYYAAGAPVATPEELAGLDLPVLMLAGEVDATPSPAAARQAAQLFQRCDVVVQPGAGHYPWQDDPAFFRNAIADFLAG